MTSLRQLEANRLNAQRSTGPKSLVGKERSRRNAVRHGLCAETVIHRFEEADEFQAFAEALARDFPTRNFLERELLGRLIAILWRLRRSARIETSLIGHQAHALAEERVNIYPHGLNQDALTFQRVVNFNGTTFECLMRYERYLFRQASRLIELLGKGRSEDTRTS